MYCDRDNLDAQQLAFLLAQSRQRDEARADQNNSIELMLSHDTSPSDAIPLSPLSRDSESRSAFAPLDGACRHCSPAHSSVDESTPHRPSSRSRSQQSAHSSAPDTASTSELRHAGQHVSDVHVEPLALGDNSFDADYVPVRVPYDPIRRKGAELHERDIQC